MTDDINLDRYAHFRTIADVSPIVSRMNRRHEAMTRVWSFALYAVTITGTVAYLGPHVDLRSQQNLAQAKPTEQSGTEWTYSRKPLGGGVSRTKAGNSSQAVDGNLQTNWENATCTLTSRDNAPWWMVDLQALYLVERIAIFLPPIYVLLKNFTISTAWYLNETSDDRRLIRPSLCYQNYTNDNFPVGRNDFTCYSARVARYVRVDKSTRGPTRLSLCQVEVYGSITQWSADLEARPNKKSQNRLIHRVQRASVLQCAAQCRLWEECTSFNMAALGGACELIEDPLTNLDGNEVATLGWTRYTFVQ